MDGASLVTVEFFKYVVGILFRKVASLLFYVAIPPVYAFVDISTNSPVGFLISSGLSISSFFVTSRVFVLKLLDLGELIY